MPLVHRTASPFLINISSTLLGRHAQERRGVRLLSSAAKAVMPILVASAVVKRSGFATRVCLTQIQTHHSHKSLRAPEGSIAGHRVVPRE